MNLLNHGGDHLALGWVTGRYSAKIPPKIPEYSVTFIVKSFYHLKPGEPPIAVEDQPPGALSGDLPIKDNPSLGMGYASDFIPYKPVADFSAVGTAYPPKGSHKQFLVTMRVGDRSRKIGVAGDRFWKEGLLGDTRGEIVTPAVETTLSYDNAWGGHEDPMNPLGCGKEGALLPRLELPDNPILERRTHAAPAVFAPMPPDHPLRKSKMGTYNQDWVETRWPWLPEDFDYSFFNAVSSNQWMEGYLRGDEELEFENMHPEIPLYKSRLPGIRIRCFADRITNWRLDLPAKEAITSFEEIPMDLDTLWADMDEEKLILTWRGRAPVKSLKRRDLKSLFVITEPLDQPTKELAYYHSLYLEELAKRPKKPTTEDPLDPAAFCKEHGIPSAASIREEVQSELKEAFSKASSEWDEAMKSMSKQLDSMAAKAPAEAAQARAEMAKASAAGNPFANYLADPKSFPKSPPTSATDIVSSMEKGLGPLIEEAAKALQIALTDSSLPQSAKLAIVTKQKELSEGVSKLKSMATSMEKTFGEMQAKMEKLFPPRREGEEILKEGVPDLPKIRSEGLANANLAGFDFSGLDLSGVDFSGSLLNEALFVGCNLQNANFSKATMMETDLSQADLTGSTLDEVDLSSCKVEGARWRGASLNNTNFSFLKLAGADFSKSSGERADFTGADLSQADFKEASLTRSDFINALLLKADFSRANLADSTFVVARAAGVVMNEADLSRLAGGVAADFTGAQFQRVKAVGSSWGESTFTGADFRESDFMGAIFSDGKLEKANFDRCDLRQASFDEAFLQGAVLTNANLMKANFDHADLTEVRMDGSNLYGAALWNAVLLRATWNEANITKTRLDT